MFTHRIHVSHPLARVPRGQRSLAGGLLNLRLLRQAA